MSVKFRYPRLCNWLLFWDEGGGKCRVYDQIEERTYLFDNRTAWFIQQLDGRHDPYAIHPQFSGLEVDTALRFLQEYHLLRQNRFAARFFGSVLFSLWIPRLTQPRRRIAVCLSRLLAASFLPLLILGLWMYNQVPGFPHASDLQIYLGLAAGILLGMTAHEIGHAVAAIAYGGAVFELGVGFRLFLPMAYTMMDIQQVRPRLQRAQIYAAGVETNLLMCGVFLVLSALLPAIGIFFLSAAVSNGLMAMLNMIFISGFDGMAIIGELLGIDELPARAKETILNSRARIRLLREGAEGKVTFFVYLLVLILQVGVPVIICLEVLEVLLWFI